MKQFLLALAFGMRPAKIYNGTDSAVEGILLVDAEGGSAKIKVDTGTFADFLFLNTRLEKKVCSKEQVWFSGKRERRVLFQTECKDWI